VSTIPWAITVPLPRFAGAVGWLLVLAVGSALLPHGVRGGLVAGDLTGESPVLEAVAVLLYPMLLVGRDLTGRAAAAMVMPALVFAVSLMAAAMWWIRRMDVPLEAAQ
jgi:hypothetical protein